MKAKEMTLTVSRTFVGASLKSRSAADGNSARMVSLVWPPKSSKVTVVWNVTGSTSSPPPWL